MQQQQEEEKLAKGEQKQNHEHSHHEIIEHPNVEEIVEEIKSPTKGPQQIVKKSRCVEAFNRFYNDTLLPFLIYKYSPEAYAKKQILNDILTKKSALLEEIFLKEEDNDDDKRSKKS